MKHTIEGYPLIGAGYDFDPNWHIHCRKPTPQQPNHFAIVYLHGKAEDLAGYDIACLDLNWLIKQPDTYDHVYNGPVMPDKVRVLTTQGLYFKALMFLWRPELECTWDNFRGKLTTPSVIYHKAFVVLPNDSQAMKHAVKCCKERRMMI